MSWRDVWESDETASAMSLFRTESDVDDPPPQPPNVERGGDVVAARKAAVVASELDVASVVEMLQREHAKYMSRLLISFLAVMVLGITYVDGLRRDLREIRRLVAPRHLE